MMVCEGAYCTVQTVTRMLQLLSGAHADDNTLHLWKLDVLGLGKVVMPCETQTIFR